MKKIVGMLCLLGAASLTRAALIADWNFNGGTVSNPTIADHGSGSLSLSGLANSSDASIISSGTSVNEVSGDLAGKALSIQAGGSGEPENGKSLIFSISTSGYQNIVLTYATEATSSGFTDQQWSYSTDGTLYISFGSAITIAQSSTFSGNGTETVDFSSATAVNNDATVYFELTLSGATGTSGADHFDNFQINAVPEPAASGAISGLGLLGICGNRIWRQQRAPKIPV